MSMFLVDHLPGCTPSRPCASCEAMAFLRAHLDSEKLRVFDEILRRATAPQPENDLLSRPWKDVLELTYRTQNGLLMDNRITLRDVVRMSKQEFMRTPNIGKVSVNELIEQLAKHGLHLGMKQV